MRSHFIALQLTLGESTQIKHLHYKESGKLKSIHQLGDEEECVLHSQTSKSGTRENYCSCDQC